MTPTGQSFRRSTRGSALLAALCFCAVLGISLASYMTVCYQTLKTSSRNNFGTHAFELAETGLEEGLWALNQTSHSWSDWTIDNSSSPKTASRTLQGFLFGNSATGSVMVKIDNYDSRLNSTGISPTLNVTATVTMDGGFTTVRKLTATAALAPLFVNAVAATFVDPEGYLPSTTRGVRFMDGGTVQSINSTLPNPADSTAVFSAVVSSGTSVSLISAQIKGYVTAAADASGNLRLLNLGDDARVVGPSSKVSIDQNRVSSSPYQPVFAIFTPTGAVELPVILPTGTVLGTLGNNTFYTTETEGEDGGLTLTGAQEVSIAGNVVLHVSGDFKIEGSAKFVVPANASLQIVITGTSSILSIGGNGIENSGQAKNVAIFYKSSDPLTNPTLSTAQNFSGVIYAPNCDQAFIVSTDIEFTGAIVAKTVQFSGSPTLKYDLDLRSPTTKFSCIDTPFMISSWKEVVP